MTNRRALVPCAVTCLSMTLGLASIALTIIGNYYWATWVMLWCVLADKLDGTLARLLQATSPLGVQLDSLSDLICFGVAPAVLVFSLATGPGGLAAGSPEGLLAALGCAFYTIAAALRLARYNLAEHPPGERFFSGVPTTSGGAISGTALAVWLKYHLPASWLPYGAGLLVLLGLGMLSSLPVPKVVPRRNKVLKVLQLAIIVAVYLCGILTLLPEFLLALVCGYIVFGSLYGFLSASSRRAQA